MLLSSLRTQAEIGLKSLGKINLLTQFFEEVMDERKVEISSLAVEDSGSGFIIETTLIIYPQSDFEEPDLARFSDELGAVLELPISIRATILHGELTEIEGAIPATATPTLQP